MHLAGRTAVVIGAGRTGLSTARFLVAYDARVRIVERDARVLANASIDSRVAVESDDTNTAILNDADVLIPSPGVARTHPLLQRAAARGVPILSEIELAYRFLSCPLLAVTGTNGKSTTTTLLGAMLRAAGGNVFVGGNLGTPLIEAVLPGAPAYSAAVAELSSFQLEWVHEFRPRLAVFLNLTPDHLDRYESMAEYGLAKAMMLARQQPDDYAVLNRDDPWVWEQRHRTRGAVVSFGNDPVEFGGFTDGDDLVYWGPDPTVRRFPLKRVRLQGAHNRENMLAAVTAAALWGVPDAAIQRGLEETDGLPHRLQLVGEHAGVRYFDDSKGTNVGAVIKSLESFPGRVVLLAGGYDKGSDFTALRPLVSERVSRLILFGAARATIAAQLSGAAEPVEVATLADAVRAAAAAARPGDTVLLSPGCASFDEFTDYRARGRRFREVVEAL